MEASFCLSWLSSKQASGAETRCPRLGSEAPVGEDAPRLQTRVWPGPARLRGVPRPSAFHPALRATTQGAAAGTDGGRRRRRRRQSARRHKVEPERSDSRRGPERPHGAGAASTSSLPSCPLPRGTPSAAGRGRSVAATREPQSDLGEPRRKSARALGGGEAIKGKEPAAGGSGRFSCSGSCCLGLGPPEGHLQEGRRCRPQ